MKLLAMDEDDKMHPTLSSEPVVSATATTSMRDTSSQNKVYSGGESSLLQLLYYRYTIMTGVYMLDPMEVAFLHFFFVLGAYFVIAYTIQFSDQMGLIDHEALKEWIGSPFKELL